MSAPFFVSRQCYWGQEPDRQNVVEIASGGIDYSNPDMLSIKYKHLGEGREYDDPRDALTAALQIRDAWRQDAPNLVIHVVHGATGGFTLPFEHEDDEDEKALWEWANAAHEKLQRCAWCSKIIADPDRAVCLLDYPDDLYCSEHCAQRAAEKLEEELYEEHWALGEETT